MKILHTADWHAGRSLHGADRTAELGEALQELVEVAVTRGVQLILVAGDLFDSKNPSAAAEEAVFRFFVETGRAGIPSIIIAGNHDSPARLDAFSRVLQLTRTHALGSPRVAGQGGAFDLEIAGEQVRIAALPFVSERRLVRLEDLLERDEGQQRERYQHGMRRLIANLTAGFRADAVNLLLLHTTMEGATLANSEYVFHSTSAYTLQPDVLPDTANYVALGHIHKPQPVQGFPAHAARYSGSLLQLDFGEQGDNKVAYLLEAEAGRPTELLEEVQVRAGRRLRRVVVDEDDLERRTPELAEFGGWLKLVVRLAAPRPGLKERVRRALPNVLVVELQLPEEQEDGAQDGVDLESVSLLDAYARYYREERGSPLPRPLRDAFQDLYERVGEAEEA